ncbi:MAG: 16S rRNA (uracil(1498)-N(3))-methyltransferase [Clostridiales bacterium]|nr:16S rRNA (uracil(1498)-N(3))-methyltransferase [Clostridiales bacterium]
MKRFFGRKCEDKIIIEEDEFFHLKKVLRLNEGDEVIASVNDENDYYCHIAKINKNDCLLNIDRIEKCPALPNRDITLFQMMPKKDYFDAILAKSIELGVNEIVPFSSEWTQNKTLKRERVQTQIQTACKQCERSKLPFVSDIISFDKMIEKLKDFDVVIFAYENEEKAFDSNGLYGKQKIAVIVGNEAGFSEKEAEKIKKQNVQSISLGKRILRCDTAVVATLALVSVLSEN